MSVGDTLKYRVRFLINACRELDSHEVVVSVKDTLSERANTTSAILAATAQLDAQGITHWVHKSTERARDLEPS